jgi:hypothetical protein
MKLNCPYHSKNIRKEHCLKCIEGGPNFPAFLSKRFPDFVNMAIFVTVIGGTFMCGGDD